MAVLYVTPRLMQVVRCPSKVRYGPHPKANTIEQCWLLTVVWAVFISSLLFFGNNFNLIYILYDQRSMSFCRSSPVKIPCDCDWAICFFLQLVRLWPHLLMVVLLEARSFSCLSQPNFLTSSRLSSERKIMGKCRLLRSVISTPERSQNYFVFRSWALSHIEP